MRQPNRVLVTGGTGLLGNNTIRQLLAQGRTVRALVRDAADPRPFDGLRVEFVRGDLRHAEAVDQAVRGCDGVVHSAGFVHLGWSQRQTHQEINAEGARNVALASRAHGARLVHVSTVNALGLGTWKRPACEQHALPGIVPCPYVMSKRAGEDAVRELMADGLDGVIVNPAFLLGPWDWKPSSGRMLLELARKRFLIAPSGAFSICDVRDVAAAVIGALDHPSPAAQYVLGGHNLSYFDSWKRIAATIGSPSPSWSATTPAQIITGWLGDVWGRLSGREPLLNSASTGLARQLHLVNSARAAEQLGYRFRLLEDTVRDSWEWFLDHGYVAPPRQGLKSPVHQPNPVQWPSSAMGEAGRDLSDHETSHL